MEYILVKVQQKNKPASNFYEAKNGARITLPVVINGEHNGFVGKVLEVSDGTLEVDVAITGSIVSEKQTVTIDQNSTQIKKPKEVVINVS